MTTTVNGKDVKVLRDAKAGDPNFDADKGPQVIVENADGSESTVLRSDVKNK
jgi:hypothetical protein